MFVVCLCILEAVIPYFSGILVAATGAIHRQLQPNKEHSRTQVNSLEPAGCDAAYVIS